MKRRSIRFFSAIGVAALLGFGSARPAAAQDQPQDSQPVAPIPEQPAHPADGRRHADLPVEAYAVVPGTKFLKRLGDALDTKVKRDKKSCKVVTVAPL